MGPGELMRPLKLALILLAALTFAPPVGSAAPEEIDAGRLHQLADQLKNPTTPRRAVAASKVSLDFDAAPLGEVLAQIEKQTGNRTIDQRQSSEPSDAGAGPAVSLRVTDEPYWSAIDQLLDANNLDVSNQSGENALAIVERELKLGSRARRAVYAGPLRFEALDVHAQRGLRHPQEKSLAIELEVAWEPRLRPLVVSLAAAELVGMVDQIAPLAPRYPQGIFAAEVPAGTQAIELTLPFELPPRKTARVTSLAGKLRALIPGKIARFEFDDLAQAKGKTQQIDDTEIIIDDVRKNGEVWEIHMRLKLDPRNPALDSQSGWAFENPSYLVDAQGEKIENAGLETTAEGDHELGVAYFFDVADLDGTRWVYETPAQIAEAEVDFELKDIDLP
jgi:hypothetical protein